MPLTPMKDEQDAHLETLEKKFDVEMFKSLCSNTKQKVFEIMEELKLKKANEVENEEKINRLLKQKLEDEMRFDEEIAKLKKSLTDAQGTTNPTQDQAEATNLKDKFFEDMTDLSEAVSNRELKALKDEIIALQLGKYNLEKKVKEQEKQINMQLLAKENQSSQVSALATRCRSLEEECNKLLSRIVSIESRVAKASSLQLRLKKVNEYQQSMIQELQAENKREKELRVTVKAVVDSSLVNERRNQSALKNTSCTALDTDRHLENLKSNFEAKIKRLTAENERLLDCDKKSSSIIRKLSQRLDLLTSNEAALQLHVDELKQELEIARRSKPAHNQNISETESSLATDVKPYDQPYEDDTDETGQKSTVLSVEVQSPPCDKINIIGFPLHAERNDQSKVGGNKDEP